MADQTRSNGTAAEEPELEAGTRHAKKDAAEEEHYKVSYFSLFKYADRLDYVYMAVGTVGCVIAGAAMPMFALIWGEVINDFGQFLFNLAGLQAKINSSVIYFVYLGVVAAVGSYAQNFFWASTAVRQVNRLRSLYLRRVLHQEIGYFDTAGTSGRLLQGLNEDCITVQTAIGDKLSMFIFFSATFCAGVGIAMSKGWDMALVVMSLLPVLGGAGFAIMVLVGKATSVLNRAYADAGALAQAALANVRTVYAFNGEERTLETYDASLERPTAVGIKLGAAAGATLGVVNFVAFSAYALAMWYGAQRVIDGDYTGGQVVQVLFTMLIGGFALGQAAPNLQYFQQGKVAAGRLFAIIDRDSAIDSDAPGDVPAAAQGAIELRGVTFAYPARPDKPVFENFSLSVPAGATVALVGESGSGKSTAVQLIERFYDPQGGAVLLDGVDVRTLQLRWLRSQMGLVSQEPTLFGTTVRENILFGKPDASAEEVEAAARAANAHAFISALPRGYDTFVGERGLQMSGGQKQRIAIARAVLADPKILLLDEATSALDAGSERIVQDALDRLQVGRTTVVVAHRLSTVRDADAIAVVYGGKVVERGTHEELLAANGAYATLVQMQQSTEGGQGSPQGSPRARRRHSMAGAFSLPIEEEEAAGGVGGALKGAAGSAVEAVREGVAGLARRPGAVGVGGAVMAPQRMVSGWRRFMSWRMREGAEGEGEGGDAAVDGGATVNGGAAPPPARYGTLRQRSNKSTTKKKKKKKGGKGAAEDDEPKAKVGFRRLAALNKPELPAALGGLLGSAAMGMLFPIFAIAFSSLVAVFYAPPDEIQSGAQKWSLVFFGIGLGSLIAAWAQSFFFNLMGQRLGRRVRVLMMRALLRQEVGWFDEERNSSGVLTAKLSADALSVRGQFGDTMGLVTQNLVTMVAAFVIAGVNSWRMMLVVSACLPMLAASVIIQNALILGAGKSEEEQFAVANATAAEAFQAARTVSAFGMEDQVGALYARELAQPTRDARKRANYAGCGAAVSQFIIFAVYALAFWYMGIEVSHRYSTFEQALKAFMAIFMAAMGIAQAQMFFPDVAKGQAAVNRVFSIIDRVPAIDASDPGGLRPTAASGAVELRDVTFAYPMRPEAPVFEGFSLAVPAGATVALVGESGSGKSTVVQLIERFYDPQGGAVLFDGHDVRGLNLHWLRSQIGLVSQEPVLFNMSVADNIRYGCPQASLESAIEAAKAANAHAFISALPEGYHTRLGEGAIQLSGGQKQRVAIARAVIKDCPLLLLDEATSALDTESERLVQEALDRLMAGRTTVVVAHRLSTVKDADAIAVVYKGKLVEQGTHAELVALNGAYARLVAHQMR